MLMNMTSKIPYSPIGKKIFIILRKIVMSDNVITECIVDTVIHMNWSEQDEQVAWDRAWLYIYAFYPKRLTDLLTIS